MKTTCIINNYNYGRYLPEAVESVLGQSVPFDQIILIDDASGDDSRRLIRDRWEKDPRVTCILKDENGGQLSCFNEAKRHVTGEIICFLDADDRYTPDYLASTLNFLAKNPSFGFVWCAHRRFGQAEGEYRSFAANMDLGCSAILTMANASNSKRVWVGSATSTLALRRPVFDRILPYPHFQEWRTSADDMLVLGASLAGARKGYNDAVLVEYRVHGENNWCGKPVSCESRYRKSLAVMCLFSWYRKELGFSDDFASLAYQEFHTIRKPSTALATSYISAVFRSRMGIVSRLHNLSAIAGHYIKTRGLSP